MSQTSVLAEGSYFISSASHEEAKSTWTCLIFKEHEAANLGRADTAILEGDKAGPPQKVHKNAL